MSAIAMQYSSRAELVVTMLHCLADLLHKPTHFEQMTGLGLQGVNLKNLYIMKKTKSELRNGKSSEINQQQQELKIVLVTFYNIHPLKFFALWSSDLSLHASLVDADVTEFGHIQVQVHKATYFINLPLCAVRKR